MSHQSAPCQATGASSVTDFLGYCNPTLAGAEASLRFFGGRLRRAAARHPSGPHRTASPALYPGVRESPGRAGWDRFRQPTVGAGSVINSAARCRAASAVREEVRMLRVLGLVTLISLTCSLLTGCGK